VETLVILVLLETLVVLDLLVLKVIEVTMETLDVLETLDLPDLLDLVETMVPLDDRLLDLLETLALLALRERPDPEDLLVLKVLVESRVSKEKLVLLSACLVVLLDLVVLEVPLVSPEKLPRTFN